MVGRIGVVKVYFRVPFVLRYYQFVPASIGISSSNSSARMSITIIVLYLDESLL